MLTFKHGSKEFYLERALRHEKEKNYRQDDYYWSDGKGSALGCLAETSDKPEMKLEKETGIPANVWLLMEAIFEGLPNGKYQKFPRRFIAVIKPDINMKHVVSSFVKWLLSVELPNYYDRDRHMDVDQICVQVLNLHKNLINDHCNERAWTEAQSRASKLSSNISFAAAYGNNNAVLTTAYVISAINYATRINSNLRAVKSVAICANKCGISYEHMSEVLLNILKEIGGENSISAKSSKQSRHLVTVK